MEPRETTLPQMVIGTDNQKTLTSAVTAVFPSCRHTLCTLHLKKYTIQHLQDEVGVEMRGRNSLVDLMFGRGVVKSTIRAENDIRVARAATQWPAVDE
ncbi:hypothetical protein RRG08_007334 [Elysia crispata]|uniref:Uncharacterized protein n=1 Tax=Elysia crispata TaxID=231223 RepID=A0AAE1E2Q7_9GAST|nr:hypothetical protein RRG08_007334 [Elysia crispata]